MAFQFSEPPKDLSQAVHEAGGAFSVCWGADGVFMDQRALDVAQGLIKWVEENYVPKSTLGGQPVQNATTFGPGYDDQIIPSAVLS